MLVSFEPAEDIDASVTWTFEAEIVETSSRKVSTRDLVSRAFEESAALIAPTTFVDTDVLTKIIGRD